MTGTEEDERRRFRPGVAAAWGGALAALLVAFFVVLLATDNRLAAGVVAVAIGLAAFIAVLHAVPVVLQEALRGDAMYLGILLTVVLSLVGIVIGLISLVPEATPTGPLVERPAALHAGLLVPEDLPEGWGYIPAGETSGPSGIGAQEYCGTHIATSPIAEETASLAEASTLFGEREYVFSVVATFGRGEAASFFDQLEGSTGCGSWEPGAPGLVYVLEEQPSLAEGLGDDALALELSNEGGGPQTAVHVFVRVGDTVGMIAYNMPEGPPPSVDLAALARIQAEKVREVATIQQG